MSNYSVLKQDINNNIYENQTQQITGTVLNAILNEMTASLGAGYQFAGVATLGMNPGDPDQRVFYLAGEGIYTNFGGIQVPAGKLGVLKWDNRWTLQTIDGLGGGGANLTGYVSVASTDDLPDEGVATLGYLCGTNLYLYVGEGGDTKEGKYQDCGSFRGPEGDSVQDVEQTQTSLENGGVNKIKFTLSNGISCEFQVRNGTTSSGLFPTVAALQAAYPSPVVGQYAFVGAGFPADIYVCTTAGTWTDSGEDYDGDNVDLTNYATKAELNQLEAEVNGDSQVTISLNQNTTSGSAIPATPSRDLSAILKAGKRYKITWTGLGTLVKKLTFYTRDESDSSVQTYWAPSQSTSGSYTALGEEFDIIPSADVYKLRLYAGDSDVIGTGTIDLTITNYPASTGLVGRINTLESSVSGIVDALENTNEEIAEQGAEINKKVEIKPGKNLFNESTITTGKAFNSSGNLINNSSYAISDYIPVIAEEEYTATYRENGAFYPMGGENASYVFYDADKTKISHISGANETFTAPVGASFVRVTTYINGVDNLQVEKSSTRTQYEPYSPIGGYPVEIGEKSIGVDKLTDEVSGVIYGIRGNYLTGESASFNDGDTISIGSNRVKSNKHLSFVAKVTSFSSLLIGHGKNTYLGSWLEITGTSIVCHNYTTADSTTSVNHGLTIKTNIQVVIEQGAEDSCSVRLTSNGNTYTHTFTLWRGSAGNIFAESVGSTLTDAVLAWSADGLTQDIWAFGDSTFSLTDPARWTYYVINGGHTKWLINAQSGCKSAGALTNLQALILLGRPKKILWALGGNDPDNANSVNYAWKTAYDAVMAICEENNIELILSTVPTMSGGTVDDSDVPANLRINKWKNAIVRSSGYRYIDLDSAVGANEETGQWYAGMLSSDGVHPTPAGAITLYHQAVADMPELLTT